MDAPGALLGGIQNGDGRRGSDGHGKPDQGRQSKAGEGCNLKPKSMPGSEVADHAEGQKEDATGNGSKSDEPNVNDAMDLLPAAAALAGGEVAFIVATHFRRQAGNVVSPARQDFSNNWIDALLTHKILRTKLPDFSP